MNTCAISLDAAQIREMDFCSLVGITNEPNTPSGGATTIHTILQQAICSPRRILDVGCNTGFATIEFGSWTTSEVVGVDINSHSLHFASEKARIHNLNNVFFECASALDLPFQDESFDMVYVNNVTSFIQEREKAITEYFRVLSKRGILAVVPIYYHKVPPDSLRKEVEKAIGAEIALNSKSYWQNCFGKAGLSLFFDQDYEYVMQSDSQIEIYLERVMSQPHVSEYPESVRGLLKSRLSYFYRLFNENLTYARYCILLYRKDAPNSEPILFQTRAINGDN